MTKYRILSFSFIRFKTGGQFHAAPVSCSTVTSSICGQTPWELYTNRPFLDTDPVSRALSTAIRAEMRVVTIKYA